MALTAAQLPPEVLSAGDCIEYLSPKFVAGDPRGRDMALILRCGGHEQYYPLSLDNGEILTSGCLVKKLRTDSAAPPSYWRKLRTFTLVPGRVPARSTSTVLNESLRFIVDDVMSRGRAPLPAPAPPLQLAGQLSTPTATPPKPTPRSPRPIQLLSRIFDSPPPSPPRTHVRMEDVDGKLVERFELLGSQHENSDERGASHSFLTPAVDGVAACREESVWPWEVVQITRNINPQGILFPDLSAGRCKCVTGCNANCWNAAASVYCSTRNCAVGPSCVRRIKTSLWIEVVPSKTGLGVKALADMMCSYVVGEYVGELTTSAKQADASQYAVQINAKSVDRETVYIDAEEYGGITRFINHSCRPNCSFVQLQHRARIRVAVIVVRRIAAGEELTVGYDADGNTDLWFSCECGEKECVKQIEDK